MGKYSEVFQALLIILVLLAELQIFCWFGNELTEQVTPLEVNSIY
jgi:hypothetical protein